MTNSVIIIPTRLSAKRFPNKPLVKIKGVPMIVHVLKKALQSKVGEVFVATPDKEITKIVSDNGGQAILTKQEHLTGSDRIYEAYSNKLKDKADIIINLQGDMPNIKPESISKLEKFMRKNQCDVGTLASEIINKDEIYNENTVKVHVEQNLTKDNFLYAKDFFRTKKDLKKEKIYHHVGIYAFTKAALTKYVNLSRSKLEIERNLEQMRALENDLIIKVGLCEHNPLSVDTEEDLRIIEKEMSDNQ